MLRVSIVFVVLISLTSCASVTSSYCLLYQYDSADQAETRRAFQNDAIYECMCLDLDKPYCKGD